MEDSFESDVSDYVPGEEEWAEITGAHFTERTGEEWTALMDSAEAIEEALAAEVQSNRADPLNVAIEQIDMAKNSNKPIKHLVAAQKLLSAICPSDGATALGQFRDEMVRSFKEYVTVAMQGPDFPGFERTQEGFVLSSSSRRLLVPSDFFKAS